MEPDYPLRSRAAPLMGKALAACGGLAFIAACASSGAFSDQPEASARLKPTAGQKVNGQVWLVQEGDRVVVRVHVTGLLPNQEHGFHIHEKGDCSSPDAASAGEHLNPAGQPHGPSYAPHHAGDLPSLKADAQGVADSSFEVRGLVLNHDLLGRALVVHASPDDYATQPSGNSGARVACGVISHSA